MTNQRPEGTHNRRADIDGLRCVAVGAVLLFHVDDELLPAGFLGVDVFFAISGYVVCRSLTRQDLKLDGSFALEFYLRRIQRLFPALLATIALTVLAYGLFVFPTTTASLMGLVPFSLVGLGNYWLLSQGFDYFHFDIDVNPLMHTWSLGVEEQFYLLFPLLLIAARGGDGKLDRRRARVGVALVLASSLITYVVLAERAPLVAYLSTPTRIWEIAAGALLALHEPRLSLSGWSESRRGALSTCCFALLLLSFLGTDKFGQIPVRLTLVAVGLTLCLITVRSTLADRTYGHPYLARIGVASYVIYLVHWPVLCFYRWIGGQGGASSVVALAIIALLSLGMHRWVERIWQGRRVRRRTVLGSSVALLLMLSVASAVLSTGVIYLGRTPAADTPDRWWSKDGRTEHGCHRSRYDAAALESCLGAPPGSRRIVVVGDSHAGNWMPLAAAVARARGLLYTGATVGAGCAVMPPAMISDGVQRKTGCREYNRFVRDSLIPSLQEGDLLLYGISRGKVTEEDEAQLTTFLHQLAGELERRGASLVLMDDLPHLNTQPDRCLPHWWFTPPPECNLDAQEDLRLRAPLSRALRAVEGDNVRVLDPWPLVCPGPPMEPCAAWQRDGSPAYIDREHISVQTSLTALGWFLDGVELREEQDPSGEERPEGGRAPTDLAP